MSNTPAFPADMPHIRPTPSPDLSWQENGGAESVPQEIYMPPAFRPRAERRSKRTAAMTFLRKQPVEVVLGVFGAGLIIGLLSGRRG